MRKRWIIVTLVGTVLHMISWPLLFILAYGSAMSAFSPNHTPPQRTYWKRDESAFTIVWSAGYKLSSTLVDYAFFGGPLPPEPVNPDFSDPHVYEKIKTLGENYFPEYNRRKGAYFLCWIFNELSFGMVIATIYVLFAKNPRRRRHHR